LSVTAFWDLATCSLVEVDRGNIYFHETTQRYIQVSCHLLTPRRENLKLHTSYQLSTPAKAKAIPIHAMKALGGRDSSYSFLTSALEGGE
jgi:hypothetical protein